MEIRKEVSLKDFEFWAGATSTVEYLTEEELDTIEEMLEETGTVYSETDLNDFFWFEADTIAEWLGYRDFEAIIDERAEVYDIDVVTARWLPSATSKVYFKLSDYIDGVTKTVYFDTANELNSWLAENYVSDNCRVEKYNDDNCPV